MAEEKLTDEAVPEETEFDEAFNEFAAAGEPGEESPDDDETQAAIEPEAKADSEDDKAGDNAVEADGEAENAAADQSPEAAADPEKDPYEGLPAAVKDELTTLKQSNEDLTHRLKSDAGRVSAFQRQVNQLSQEIQAMKVSPAEQPTAHQIADAMKGSDEEWEQFAEDYPQVAKAIDNRMEKFGQAAEATVQQTLAPVIQRQDQVELNQGELRNQERVDAVAAEFPTWTEAVKTDEFALWLDGQPPGINALAESDDTDDASALIGLYDAHLVASGQPTLRKDPTEPGVKNEEPDNSLAKRRAQQLSDGATVPSKPAGIDPGGEVLDEFDQAFAYHAKRKDEARRRA